MNGINAENFFFRQVVSLAGGAKKLAVKPKSIVCDKCGIGRPSRKMNQDLFWSWCGLNGPIAHSSVTFDEGRYRTARSGITRKGVLRTKFTLGEAHGRDLDKFISIGIKAGRF